MAHKDSSTINKALPEQRVKKKKMSLLVAMRGYGSESKMKNLPILI